MPPEREYWAREPSQEGALLHHIRSLQLIMAGVADEGPGIGAVTLLTLSEGRQWSLLSPASVSQLSQSPSHELVLMISVQALQLHINTYMLPNIHIKHHAHISIHTHT